VPTRFIEEEGRHQTIDGITDKGDGGSFVAWLARMVQAKCYFRVQKINVAHLFWVVLGKFVGAQKGLIFDFGPRAQNGKKG
jgi:hypothetical protein